MGKENERKAALEVTSEGDVLTSCWSPNGTIGSPVQSAPWSWRVPEIGRAHV